MGFSATNPNPKVEFGKTWLKDVGQKTAQLRNPVLFSTTTAGYRYGNGHISGAHKEFATT